MRKLEHLFYLLFKSYERKAKRKKGWPTEMSKMIQGKNAEMEKQHLLQNVENIFGQIGQSIENSVYDTLKVFLVGFFSVFG